MGNTQVLGRNINYIDLLLGERKVESFIMFWIAIGEGVC